MMNVPWCVLKVLVAGLGIGLGWWNARKVCAWEGSQEEGAKGVVVLGLHLLLPQFCNAVDLDLDKREADS